MNSQGGVAKGKKSRNPQKKPSSFESTPTEANSTKIQDVYNLSSKLLNSSQTTAERNETFDNFLADLNKLQKQHGENLSKIFLDKEPLFYSLFTHIAQHDFLFTADQYGKLYHFKHLLLPKQHRLINEDRSMFARQRILTPFETISTHIRTVKQIQQTIFNDFEEYIIRATSPISIALYDLIKFLLRSNIHVDEVHLNNLTHNILFNLKKTLFSNEQITELQSYLSIRLRRFERAQAKSIWKERLNLFKTRQLSVDLKPWLDEFEQILQSTLDDDEEDEQLSNDVIHHAMWYFAVLIMSSSGHLNSQQYEHVLKIAIQSRLFNDKQKFYFQFYIEQTHAPISIEELNEIENLLANTETKDKAYQRIRTILNQSKPIFTPKEVYMSTMMNFIRMIFVHFLVRDNNDGYSSNY